MSKDSPEKTFYGCFGMVSFILVMVPIIVFVEAYIVQTMWGWFLTPATRAAVPPYWVIYGLMILVSAVTFRVPVNKNQADFAIEGKGFAMSGEFTIPTKGLPQILIERMCAWLYLWGIAWLVKTYGPMIGG